MVERPRRMWAARAALRSLGAVVVLLGAVALAVAAGCAGDGPGGGAPAGGDGGGPGAGDVAGAADTGPGGPDGGGSGADAAPDAGADAGGADGQAAPDDAAGLTDGGDAGAAADGGDAGAAPDAARDGGGPDAAHRIGLAFAAPEPGATLEGLVAIRVRPVGAAALDGERVTVALDGEVLWTDTKLPLALLLDSTLYPNGAHELTATLVGDEGPVEVSRSVAFDNPTWRFERVATSRPAWQRGETVRIDVSLGAGQSGLTLTADFAALDPAWTPGAETVEDAGDGQYVVTYAIDPADPRPDGTYPVVLAASDGSGRAPSTVTVDVALTGAPGGLTVEGGVALGAAPPEVSAEAALRPGAPQVTGNEYIITGGLARLRLSAQDPQGPGDVRAFVVEPVGADLHYQVPADGAGGAALRLALDPDAELPDDLRLPLRFAAQDAAGHVGPYTEFVLSAVPVLTGEVQVSASWDTFTDLDLHVIEPSGEELYYGHRQSETDGVLDLDSNPACSLDRINNENVSWSDAPDGCYTALVDYWSSCGGQDVNWTVIARVRGVRLSAQGTLTGADASSGSQCGGQAAQWAENGCVPALTFCTHAVGVRGTVRYEDRLASAAGIGPAVWRPVRHARAELRAAADDALLAETATDAAGAYELGAVAADQPVYVLVQARTATAEGYGDLAVLPAEGAALPYIVRSDDVAVPAGGSVTVDLDVPRVAPDGSEPAGAFNILDVALAARAAVAERSGVFVDPLPFVWDAGSAVAATVYCAPPLFASGGCAAEGAIFVAGSEENRDEYDDALVARAVWAAAERQITRSDSPGGAPEGGRTEPRRAWSEGLVSFLAAEARQDPVLVDERPGGVLLIEDLEAATAPLATGTSDGAVEGLVSPALVAAVLWDLADDEAEDPVPGTVAAVYDVLRAYLGAPDGWHLDRGANGRDLVDFLDGWFCRGHGWAGAIADLLEERAFPYDFAGPGVCD